MEQERVAHYKEKLEAELRVVEKELEGLGRQAPGNTKDWEATPGEIDYSATESDEVADRIEALEENQAEVAGLEVQWHALKHAIDKIENGGFGTCEVCNMPIEEDRLDANPSARTCKAHMKEEGDLVD